MMKKILITGATDGIGLETAKILASQGHHLLIHGRNPLKLQQTIQLLKEMSGGTQIDSYQADLSLFSDVNELTFKIKIEHEYLDAIINNAGVFKTGNTITDDGLDVRFMVNTIAPYIITKHLTPLLSENARVVNLSSAAQAPVNIDALLGKHVIDDDFQAYAQSKLALTVWSQEMAKSLKSNQVIVAVNPGSLLASKMVKEGFGLAGNDLSIGANILVEAVNSAEFLNASGKYFDNDAQQFSSPHKEAEDPAKCEQLMAALMVVTNVKR
ncbi:SDR family NAD(P)-dependent oxidoreductase [Thalassotalea sp. SU-HH00458]|uniref:SDR family NAD(P)-dependent oxidoreductase n=1 Tax=Thalassotalea sp. SU-HH00458 TaxID=3127657 RepID=UPI00310798BB